MADVLNEVFAEMRKARDKHGDNYMGNLTADKPADLDREHQVVLEDLVAVGRMAKFEMEEEGRVTRSAVFAEEVGELAEDLLYGRDYRAELVQVAAMALARLGVEPTAAEHPCGYPRSHEWCPSCPEATTCQLITEHARRCYLRSSIGSESADE